MKKCLKLSVLIDLVYYFQMLNKFINNGDGECNLLEKYYTINNKNYNKIINNNNIIDILEITLNNSNNLLY